MQKGAFVNLVTGLVVAALRIFMELIKDSLGPNGILYAFGNMNFLSFASWFFLFCVILITVMKFFIDKRNLDQIKKAQGHGRSYHQPFFDG